MRDAVSSSKFLRESTASLVATRDSIMPFWVSFRVSIFCQSGTCCEELDCESETPDCSGGGRGRMDSLVKSTLDSPSTCKSSVATGKTELLPSFEYDEFLAPESKERESWLLSVTNGEVPLSCKGSKSSTWWPTLAGGSLTREL